MCFDAVAAFGQAPKKVDAEEPERGKITSLTHNFQRNAQELSNRV